MEQITRRNFLSSAAAAAAGVTMGAASKRQTTAETLALTGADKSNAKELNERLLKFADELRQHTLTTLAPLLPLLLNLRGQPYTIGNHFPFEPFFKTQMPQRTVLCTGRQVSKSTSLAAQSVVLSNCIPYFNTLFVTPQYELTRRFSNNYVRAFIDQSPVKKLWTGTTTENSVLQRSFKNNSKLIFSFALLDADRTRGVPADKIVYDEVQDMDPDFIPIINETISASSWKIENYAGTPKTMDGTLERLFQQSSMAEWAIKCTACGHWNIPGLDHDLIDMIGPDLEEISPSNPGIVCAACKRRGKRSPVNPRTGIWVHAKPELRHEFSGYHVPQMIMPMHYEDPTAWRVLVGKSRGSHNTPLHVFYNECCGESFDFGAKLVTQTDIQAAAQGIGPNEDENAFARLDNYTMRILAVDWGGGGEKEISFTTMAVLGLLPNGQIEVVRGHRSLTPNDPVLEARMIMQFCGRFRCSHIVHDYSGAGALREQFLANAGIPYSRIVPIAYIRAASGPMMRHVEATELHPRDYFRVDKTRSLLLTCHQLRTRKLRFFDYDHKGAGEPGLLHDFLALIEDKKSSRTGSDGYCIIRKDKSSDDFAQAVNIGCCGLWYMTQSWPNIAELSGLAAPEDAMESTRDRFFDLGMGDD